MFDIILLWVLSEQWKNITLYKHLILSHLFIHIFFLNKLRSLLFPNQVQQKS